MNRRIAFVLTAACLVIGSSDATAKLRVVATITDLGSVAAFVGGDDIEVHVLCPGPMDPHYLPAKPSLARQLTDADLLVYNGLELEIGWLPPLIDKARNRDVDAGRRGNLDCSEAVTVLLQVPAGTVDRGQGDIHPLGNPHYSLDPRRMVAVAQLMADRMAVLDPERADRYFERADRFASEIETRLMEWEEQVAAAVRYPIIIYRRHWTYLADWLGLDIVGEIEHRPGIAPSPRHVRDVIAEARALGKVILISAQWDHQDAVNEVADRIGCPSAVLPGHTGALPGTDDYFALIDTICSRLAAAADQLENAP
jgi:zinc/manganese transport system substrate-binding protein